MENYDVIVIGAGISGLTAAALLANRQKKVALIDAQAKPGGSCGIFKRNGVIFEQGTAMLYGFGEKGFNPHRYVFNVLKEPITLLRHKQLFSIQYGEREITFPNTIEEFVDELSEIFPLEKKGIRQFYHDMEIIYRDVILSSPVFQSPDVVPREQSVAQFKENPKSYLKFLTYMNKSVKKLLKKYMKGDEILKFFDKITSSYCYATVAEAPAVLGAVMFIDNHFGGSYYPVGSTMMMTGVLERSIEEHGGDIYYHTKVEEILVEEKQVHGVRTIDGRIFTANQVIYSGNIWSLYDDLLHRPMKKRYQPTYASNVYYALVEHNAIPDSAPTILMLVSDKDEIADSELTIYVFSKEDKTLCPSNQHVVVAIGPSLCNWPSESYGSVKYMKKKHHEMERVKQHIEKQYPGFCSKIIHEEFATPNTLERYILKYHGAVAGPKQMLGQHMLKRQHIKTKIHGLYVCGEGTVMGTGTPSVTASAIGAANVALRESGCKEYTREDEKENYVTILQGVDAKCIPHVSSIPAINELAKMARRCQFCEEAKCVSACENKILIPDITRRLAVGNVVGAKKQINENVLQLCMHCDSVSCKQYCIRQGSNEPVEIKEIIKQMSMVDTE